MEKIIMLKQVSKRFFSKVSIDGDSGCWIWTAGKSQYGRFWLNGKYEQPQRVLLLLLRETPLGGRWDFYCHKCDNMRCVNPNHVFIGTPKDNMEDCVAKGRICKGNNHWTRNNKESRRKFLLGENNPNSKLTQEKIINLRRMRKEGVTYKELGEIFNISAQTAWNICHNNIWKEDMCSVQ